MVGLDGEAFESLSEWLEDGPDVDTDGESFAFDADALVGDDNIDTEGLGGSIGTALLGIITIWVEVILEGELTIVFEGTDSRTALGDAGVVVVLCGNVIGAKPPAAGIKAEGGSCAPVAPTPGVQVDQAGCNARTLDGIASIAEQGFQTPTTPSDAVAVLRVTVQSVPHSRKSNWYVPMFWSMPRVFRMVDNSVG